MKPTRKPADPQPRPGVEIGDELYVHHKGWPCTGRVMAHGRHGCTLEIDGAQHRVKWDRVFGHKKRAAQHYAVVDEGEDGMIVEDQHGRRRFVGVPNEAKDDPMVTKAQRPVVLLIKAGPMANRPGLTQKKITDRTGRQQTKWVRTQKDMPAERRRADPAEAGAEHGYGTHNLQPGDAVRFKAGDFEGGGKIVGKPGKDGAHVKDASGRVHQVRWSEITGHDDNGGADKPKVDSKVLGEQKPVPAEKFSAAEFAKSHDNASVTPESIIAGFPPDTSDKIRDVQSRLESIEETIKKFKQGDNYAAERLDVHRKIYHTFLSPERVKAATPAEGEQPTFTILGGRGGSGKSWFEGKVYDPDKAIVLDADHIKGMLPEYEGWNAAEVHEESSDIMNTILTAARMKGLNVVLDGTLATQKSAMQKVEAFKGKGYRIEAHYMHLPRQEAAKRAVARFLGKTQRYVPVDVVLDNQANEANFDIVRQHADKWSFRDNNVEQGQEPILISESGGDATPQPGVAKKDEAKLNKSDQSPIIALWRRK